MRFAHLSPYTACSTRQSAYAAKPAVSSTSTISPNAFPARECRAPFLLVASPPTPRATPIASTPTSAYETPLATRPTRPKISCQSRSERGRMPSTWSTGETTRGVPIEVRYVFVYSGPAPPSGGVRRPPLAVIAPHWRQFDGATFTVTVPSPSSPPSSYTWAGQRLTHICATSRGTCRAMRMWFGWSSRVLFPDRKTDESLSKTSFPSAVG